MRILFAAFLLFSFAACNNSEPVKEEPAAKTDSLPAKTETKPEQSYIHKFTDTAMENKVKAVLLKFPFVQKSNKYIDSISNHKHGISFMLDNSKGNDISVLAGYNSDERFETYYHFYVDPATMAVTIYDPLTNKTLPVKEYLKTLK
jgi:hypothetical protein